jgi:hypothetical protein
MQLSPHLYYIPSSLPKRASHPHNPYSSILILSLFSIPDNLFHAKVMFRFLKNTVKVAAEVHEARTAAATKYWGVLLDDKRLSDVLPSRLVIAIYNCCIPANDPPISLSIARDHSKACLMPKVLSSVLGSQT